MLVLISPVMIQKKSGSLWLLLTLTPSHPHILQSAKSRKCNTTCSDKQAWTSIVKLKINFHYETQWSHLNKHAIYSNIWNSQAVCNYMASGELLITAVFLL